MGDKLSTIPEKDASEEEPSMLIDCASAAMVARSKDNSDAIAIGDRKPKNRLAKISGKKAKEVKEPNPILSACITCPLWHAAYDAGKNIDIVTACITCPLCHAADVSVAGKKHKCVAPAMAAPLKDSSAHHATAEHRFPLRNESSTIPSEKDTTEKESSMLKHGSAPVVLASSKGLTALSAIAEHDAEGPSDWERALEETNYMAMQQNNMRLAFALSSTIPLEKDATDESSVLDDCPSPAMFALSKDSSAQSSNERHRFFFRESSISLVPSKKDATEAEPSMPINCPASAMAARPQDGSVTTTRKEKGQKKDNKRSKEDKEPTLRNRAVSEFITCSLVHSAYDAMAGKTRTVK